MKSFRLLIALLSFASASAQAADLGGITANGEVGFDYNMMSSGNQTTGIPNTGGAKNNTFRLNTAQVLLAKETDQVSFLGRLSYTPTEYTTPSGNSYSNLGGLDQVEVYYKAMPGLQIGFGRFLTTMGYESLMKYENATYNNTIANQAIVPGYGEGLRAKYVASGLLTATVSSYNRMTYSSWGEDQPSSKATEVSATGLLGDFTWFAGYLFGSDAATATTATEKTSSNIWASYKAMDNLNFAISFDSSTSNTDSAGTKWSDSTSVLATYGLGMNNLTARYEMVRGASRISYTADTVNSLTLSDKIVLSENLNAYVEYRMDQADQNTFVDKDGVATKDASMITLSALAHF